MLHAGHAMLKKAHCITPVQMANIQKVKKSQMFEEDVKEREALYTVGGDVNYTAIMENSILIPQPIKIILTRYLAKNVKELSALSCSLQHCSQ
jgi:hypothetical protein